MKDTKYEKLDNMNDFPIDIVYTWVDDSDENWLRKKNNALKNYKLSLTTESCSGRFEDHNELLFSLRSVDLYMPWVRNIFIVTDNQIPSWLDLSNPKIKIIDHKDIFPSYIKRPIFNATLIEFFIHKIPTLSEKFIYFNDDFIINKSLTKKDFFTEEGKPIRFCYKPNLNENKLNFSIPSNWHKNKDFLNKIYNYFDNRNLIHYFSQNTFDIIRLDFPSFEHFFWLKHAPYSFCKKYIEEIYKKYESYIQLIGENQFRSKTDIWLAELIAFTEKNHAEAIFSEDERDLFEFDLGYGDQSLEDILNIWDKEYKFICMAQFEKSKEQYIKIAKLALNLRFNLPSQFEKKDFFDIKNNNAVNIICNLALQTKKMSEKYIQTKDQEIKTKEQELQIKNQEIQAKSQELLIKDQEIQAKNQEIQIKNQEIQTKEQEIQKKEEHIFNITNSLRWKIPNYFYKLYKNKIKKYIPRFIFKIFKPVFLILSRLRNNNFKIKSPNKIQIKKETRKELANYINIRKKDSFDIFIFCITPYKYRHQRPQHLAEGMAVRNNRVFWIENNFITSNDNVPRISIKKEKNNLFIVKISSKNHIDIYNGNAKDEDVEMFINSIKLIISEAKIINPIAKIDHPFWEVLTNKISMPVVYDCMDNHAEFDNNENMNKKEGLLIEKSDLLITTSSYLSEKYSQKSNDHVEIRNAGEFDFFNKFIEAKPEKPREIEKLKGRKIIGYYGALANWFDLKILENIAKSHKEKEIVLIGNCLYQPIIDLSQKFKNIHLLGEKKYSDLPKFLYYFDVCVIPFVLNDLIKATDPVKLYEYFAMGKKVVATKMPEILKFEKNMWFAENPDDFSKKIETALNSNDSPKEKEDRILISKNNTWEERSERLDRILKNKFFPKISVITLSYNKKHFTEDFLDSYLNRSFYPNSELIIIDNASDQETINFLKNVENKKLSNVKIIFNGKNFGFAGGNNIGMKKAQGDYIILINNDTKVTPGWISRLVFHVNQKNVGLVGPVTNNIGNESKINIDYDQSSQIDIERKALRYTSAHWGEKLNLDRIAAFCWILSKKTYEKIGGLDERFFPAYYEDDDYCMRIKKAGYDIYCADDIFVHHFENGSVKKSDNTKWLNESRKKFDEKWGEDAWKPHKYRE